MTTQSDYRAPPSRQQDIRAEVGCLAAELRVRNDAGVDLTAGQQQIIRDADAMLAQLGVSDPDTWHSA